MMMPADEAGSSSAAFQSGRSAPLSLWAVASVVMSVLVCCPVLTMLGPLLGWKALREIEQSPMRGRRLAQIGIGLGVLTTAMSIGGYAWWNVNVRNPMLVGPQQALERGFAGDVAGFRSLLTAPASEQSDTEAAAFLSELSRRYGRFLGSSQDHTQDATGTVNSGLVLPYLFRFESEFIGGRARFVIRDPNQSGLICRFASIVIIDPVNGDLAFPPEAISLIEAEMNTDGPEQEADSAGSDEANPDQ